MGKMSDIHIDMMERCARDGNDWDALTEEERNEYEAEQLTIAEASYEQSKEEEWDDEQQEHADFAQDGEAENMDHGEMI